MISTKWRGFNGPITAEAAEAEPPDQRLFGPSYDRRQRQIRARSESDGINRESYDVWRKPRIERQKAA